MTKLRTHYALWILAISLPIISYALLDQMSFRRAEKYALDWFALKKNSDPEKSIDKYQQAFMDEGNDITGMGLLKGNQIVASFGTMISVDSLPKGPPNTPATTRIGFLTYLTSIRYGSEPATTVYFVFHDDTATLDFAWLLCAMLMTLLATSWMRRQLESQRIKMIEDNTLLSLQAFAHDFRGPFSKLRILYQLSQKTPSNDLKRYHQDIEKVLDRADDMLTDLLTLNKANLKMESILLKPFLEGICAQYADAKMPLVLTCADDLNLLANRQKTLRILVNLIDNALQHAKGKVTLDAEPKGNFICISVINDGPPIRQEDLAHLFEPFHLSRTGGSGLGLFIAHSFAKLQNGELRCHSNAERTEFSLLLTPAEASLSLRPKTDNEISHLEIAYVDDEPFFRDMVMEVLSEQDVKVHVFNDTDALLWALKSGKLAVDVIVADRFGPGFDAVLDRFADSCRDFGFKGPILLYSSSADAQAHYPGFSGVLDKGEVLSLKTLIQHIKGFGHES